MNIQVLVWFLWFLVAIASGFLGSHLSLNEAMAAVRFIDYAALPLAILILVVPRRYWTKRKALSGVASCSFALSFVQGVSYKIAITKGASNRYMDYTIPVLFAVVGVIGIGLYCFDRLRVCKTQKTDGRLFSPRDFVIALVLIGATFFLRLQGPTTMASDEAYVFAHILTWEHYYNGTVFDMSTVSFPKVFYGLMKGTIRVLDPYVEAFAVLKGISVISAAFSVGLWFFALRALTSIRVAVVACTLISLSGWHWINSRFVYIYPLDMLIMSIGFLSGILFFYRNRAYASVGLLTAVALSLLTKKIAIMLCPLMGIMLLDVLVFRRQQEDEQILFRTKISYLFFCGVFMAAPLLLSQYYQPTVLGSDDQWFRFSQALRARSQYLARWNLTPFTSIPYIFKDAVLQLYVEGYDIPRHLFLLKGPLVSPFLFWPSLAGACVSLWQFRSKPLARLSIIGLVLFLCPMVFSFPLDSQSPHGLARRMIGAIYFLGILSAIAVGFVATILDRIRVGWLLAGMVIIAVGYDNYVGYTQNYMKQHSYRWSTDHGLQRAALVQAARRAAKSYDEVLVMRHSRAELMGTTKDLPSVRDVPSINAAKDAIVNRKGTLALIMLGSFRTPEEAIKLAAPAFSEVVSEDRWVAGPLDPNGFPLILSTFFEARE